MATRTDAAQGAKPTLEDFPDAEIVGGAVIVEGKNMGTLMTTGEVEANAEGTAFLAEPPEAIDYASNPVTELPDPAPPGVFDVKDHEQVKPVAKREVRRRKMNEVAIDAMNSPTGEEEEAMKAADEAMAKGEPIPVAPSGRDGTDHEGSVSSGSAQQPPGSY